MFRIVGDDDGGELFTPEQYDDYKKKVLPMVRGSEHCICVKLSTTHLLLIGNVASDLDLMYFL